MLLLFAGRISAQPNPQPIERDWVPGRLIARAHGPEFIPLMEAEVRGLSLPVLHRSRSGERLTLAVPIGSEQVIRDFLSRGDWAKWVTRDFTAAGGQEFNPPPSEMPAPTIGTPHPHNLWFLENTGQTITAADGQTLTGVPGADVDILRAWERCQGDPSILVAVLDSGIDYAHPEFTGRIYPHYFANICPAAPPNCPPGGLNLNWCFPSPGITNATDNHGHGTAVASVLAASADNGLPNTSTSVNGTQFAGVDPQCTLVAARVGWNNGYYFSEVIAALEEIYENPVYDGVKVINISFRGYNCPPPDEDLVMNELHTAIWQLYYAGVFIVTISGNTNELNDKCPNIWPEVVMVGATNSRDERWSLSGFSSALDVVAPGWGMYVAEWTSACHFLPQYNNGTSAAAPIVSGIASLLYARAAKLGINLTPAMVYECLRLGAEPIGMAVPNQYHGWGRVNAYNSLIKLEELYYDCDADLTHGNTAGVWGYGVPNGVVDLHDLNYFTHWHGQGNVAIADIASCGDCSNASCAAPDGVVNPDDYVLYLCRWNAGCP